MRRRRRADGGSDCSFGFRLNGGGGCFNASVGKASNGEWQREKRTKSVIGSSRLEGQGFGGCGCGCPCGCNGGGEGEGGVGFEPRKQWIIAASESSE